MSDERLTGGCLCGAVTYSSAQKSDFAIICFCSDCQKISGGGHLPQVSVAKETLSFSGKVSTHTIVSDAGTDVEVGFCGTCGTTIYKAPSRFPDKVFLTAGSLDDPSGFGPAQRVFEEKKQDWDQG